MKKRVFIVHGWEGYPDEGWFPWLKKELEAKGFEVTVPQLPHPDLPKIEAWVGKLAEVVGAADTDTYFVGHSMGCQTIARYLTTLSPNAQVGGAVFVAGFFKALTNLETSANYPEVEKEWIKTPIDLEDVRSHLPKSIAIFSDNDPYVPLDNQDDFRDRLGSKIIIENNKRHFSGEEGHTELPSARDALLEIAN